MLRGIRAALPLILLLALTTAPAAEGAKRCEGREMLEPYRADEPVHQTLTNALAVLRRPQTADDRGGRSYELGGDVHKVSPPSMRLIARHGRTGFWVMGATVGLDRMVARCRRRLPPAARRREARWYRRQQARPLRLALVHGFPDAPSRSGGGFFGTAADLYAGRMYHAGPVSVNEAEEEATVAVGLAPDGVAAVTVTFGGRPYDLPVHENAWIVELPGGGEEFPRLERLEWRAADGRVVKAFDRL